jgi:hypothetical protein
MHGGIAICEEPNLTEYLTSDDCRTQVIITNGSEWKLRNLMLYPRSHTGMLDFYVII